jgi:hypothetical protein
MTDQEKAQRLLDTANRVMTYPEKRLCEVVRNGHVPYRHVADEFKELTERLSAYLK